MPFATGLAAVITVLGVLGSAPALGATGSVAGNIIRDQEWWLTGLHVTQAWRQAEGAGVTVAVLGTGVAAGDPDLSGVVITGPDYTDSGRAPGSAFWGVEGTAVAGVIAGHGYDGNWNVGIVGIAPAAKILSIRVTLEFNDPLAFDPAISQLLPGAIAHGIRYAVDHGARVIDLPLDPGTLGLTDAGDPAAAGGSTAERAAVAYALSKNVVLVAPAGDDGEGSELINYPAAYPGVISVGATNRAGQLAPFSSKRSHASLTAPGVGLVAATPPGGYDQISSTSTASGIVAGVAALILSKYPHLTVAQVTQALIESTATTASGTSLPPLPTHLAPGTGYGTVDAARAVAMAALITADSQPRPTATPSARPRQPAPRAAAAPHQPDSGGLAGSVLRGAVAGVCLLIVLLVAGLLVVRSRRQRRPGAASAGRAHARGQHEHRRQDGPPVAPAAPASAGSAMAAAGYGAALPSRAPAATPAPPVADGWRSPGGWQGGSIGEIGSASGPPARPAVAPLPRTATGSRTSRSASTQAGPAGPPWAPAPEPEHTIGPLPVTSVSSSPPLLSSGLRVPGDMAGPRGAPTEPPPPAAFDLSTPPADFDVSAPAFRLTPLAFGVVPPRSPDHPAPAGPGAPAPTDSGALAPTDPDLPAVADSDLPAPTAPDRAAPQDSDRAARRDSGLPAPAGPGSAAPTDSGASAPAGRDLPAPASPDLPTRQSLGFAAAPVPADYVAPPPSAEPPPRDYPPAAPSRSPSYIWDLAATDVFPAATDPDPAPGKEIPSAPDDDSSSDGN